MILELYLLFFGIAGFMIVIGYTTKTMSLEMIGYAFMFMLGLLLHPSFSGSLEYQTSTIISKNVSDYTVTPQYTDFTSSFYGFWLALIGVFSFALVLWRRRSYETT